MAVRKHHGQSNGGKFVFSPTAQSITEGSQGRTKEETMEEFYLLACPPGLAFLYNPRPPAQGWHHAQCRLDPYTSIMDQENVRIHAYRPFRWRHFMN